MEAYHILSAHRIAVQMGGGVAVAEEEDADAVATPPDHPPSLWAAFGTTFGSSSALMDEPMLRRTTLASTSMIGRQAAPQVRTPLHVAAVSSSSVLACMLPRQGPVDHDLSAIPRLPSPRRALQPSQLL